MGPITFQASDSWLVLDRCHELFGQQFSGMAWQGGAGTGMKQAMVGLVDYEATWGCNDTHDTEAMEVAHTFGACHNDAMTTSNNERTIMYSADKYTEDLRCDNNGDPIACLPEFSYCAEKWIEDRMACVNDSDCSPSREINCGNGAPENPGTREPKAVVNDDPPTDVDYDVKYEDVNGNFEFDIGDLQALDDNLDMDYSFHFDFNDNNQIDQGDVQALYNEYQNSDG